MENDPVKTWAYFMNVAMKARARCLQCYFDGKFEQASAEANYANGITDYIDAWVRTTVKKPWRKK